MKTYEVKLKLTMRAETISDVTERLQESIGINTDINDGIFEILSIEAVKE